MNGFLLLLLVPTVTFGQNNSSFIETVKAHLPKQDPAPEGSYIESIKKKQPDSEVSSESSNSLIERIKRKPPADQGSTESESYIEKEKAKLESGNSTGGAIAATQEGRSELKAEKSKNIHHSIGFKLGASASRTIVPSTSAGTGQTFSSIYGSNWAPELMLEYELQLLRNEYYGNLGLIGMAGFSYFSGTGQFGITLDNAGSSGTTFSSGSLTKFKFFMIPVVLGGRYTIRAAHYLQPYIQGGPALVGYLETRNDLRGDHQGYSKGFYGSGGVNILLDFLTPKAAWDLYRDYTIKRYYLTLDYSRLVALDGLLSITSSSFNVGLSYEF